MTWVAVRRVVPTRVLIGGGVLAGVIVMATVLVAYPQVERALSEKKYIASTNIETRTLRWQSALRIIASHPLTGVGPGGAAYHYVEYSGFAELAERTPVTHEMYLEVGADLGLVGLGLFLSLIIGSFTATELAVRRLRRANAPPAHPDLVAALACQGSLIAVCITSSFLSEEYYMPLWAAIAVAAAVELRTRDLGRRREVTLRASTSHHR